MSRIEGKHRQIALSLVLGALGTWAVASHLVPAGRPLSLGAALGVLLGTLALGHALHHWVLPGARARLGTYSPRGRVFWLLGCTLIAWLLLRALPVSSPKPRSFGTLTLTATGRQGPQAVGSEVWVQGLRGRDGRAVAPQEWERTGEWELRDGVWLSYQRQPATLRWQGWAAQPLTLELLSHTHSGIVRYEWNGETREVDLHHSEGRQLRLELPRSAAASSALHGVMRLLFHVSHVVSLALFLLTAGSWLASREGSSRREAPTVREALLYALPALLSGGLWLLAVFPGMMSSDSTDQWNQALTGHMHDAHPVLHTLIIRGLTRLWMSPGAVATAQILTFGALISWGCYSMRQAGLSRTGAWLTALVLGLSPVNGTLINSLWKDIPFSLSVLAVSILLFRAAELKDETSRRGFWVGLGLATVMTVHMRHNGLPVLLGAFMGMFLLEWRRWKLVAGAFVLVLLAAVGSRNLLLRAVNVPPVDSGITLIGYLGAHVAAGTELREDERALLNDIHPLDDRWNYLCFSNVPTVFDGRFNMDVVKRNKDKLPALLVELTLRNLQPVVDHAACASSMIWKLTQGRDYLNGPPFQPRPSGGFVTIYESPTSPRAEPLLPELGQRMMGFVQKSLEPDVTWIFWRPAVPLFLALLACAVVCLRNRSWRSAAVLMPILMHSVVLALLIPSPDVRYQYPVILVGQMFPLAWLLLPRRVETAQPAAEGTTAAAGH